MTDKESILKRYNDYIASLFGVREVLRTLKTPCYCPDVDKAINSINKELETLTNMHKAIKEQM